MHSYTVTSRKISVRDVDPAVRMSRAHPVRRLLRFAAFITLFVLIPFLALLALAFLEPAGEVVPQSFPLTLVLSWGSQLWDNTPREDGARGYDDTTIVTFGWSPQSLVCNDYPLCVNATADLAVDRFVSDGTLTDLSQIGGLNTQADAKYAFS